MDPAKDPAERFAAMVSGPPTVFKLDEACALLAAAFTGRERLDEVCAGLDRLASQCTEPSLRGVLATMRGRMRGNVAEYEDPRNSFIDEVLERGLGLPITLCVIAMEVGRRVGAPIVGIGLPGHFIVRDEAHPVYGDPFHEGSVYDKDGVRGAWTHLVGPGRPFDELHLAPVSERTILIRMLNNLRVVYAKRGDARAMWALAVMRGGFAELAHEAPEHARWVRHWN